MLKDEAMLDETELLKNEGTEEDKNKVGFDPLKEVDFEHIDNCSYIQTFKVYSNTTFEDIKQAACQFWGGDSTNDNTKFDMFEQNFVLTDEYFNNLATYKDTVQNFFNTASGYEPLNPDCHASVFLIKKNEQRKDLHFL